MTISYSSPLKPRVLPKISCQNPEHPPPSLTSLTDGIPALKQQLRLHRSLGPAKGLIRSNGLPREGYIQVEPRIGAIAILQPSFPGCPSPQGYVGFLAAIDAQGQIKLRHPLRHSFTASIFGRSDISFWAKPGHPNRFRQNPSLHRLRLTSTLNHHSCNLHSAPTPSASTTGHLSQEIQLQLQLDAWTYGAICHHPSTGQSDARWVRLKDSGSWLSSGLLTKPLAHISSLP